MTNPIFTIITVTLNPDVEDLIATIKSVLVQKFSEWELIIKDGGSNLDFSKSIPDDNRITYINKKDSGIFDAMNQSIDIANGRFVCFLNSGDVFYNSEVLDNIYHTHQKFPKAEFIYGDVNKVLSRSNFEFYPKKFSSYFMFSNMVCHQGWFLTLKFYKDVGGFDNISKIGCDNRFLFMIMHYKVNYKHSNKILCYLQRRGSLTRKKIYDKK